ncbi:uncharacterized protein EDB93DRAFT_1264576 [Suillus bovinus]|uniref:uncharacterized protein n=1 Tax=Suillus bovinus TaxID=48563 RepID=UPI001B8698FA|nr:uncharacterized protein EDB93DRAFT_1264576 [Suillus bovinus]KAG2155241.1 hypothetical protein EDB93DRAFT_1264576 [Suillus bovinus]
MLTSSLSRGALANPSAKRILAVIELAVFSNGPVHRNVVVINNNYTDDRLSVGLAAKHPGLKVVSVLNADDVLLRPRPGKMRKPCITNLLMGIQVPSAWPGDVNELHVAAGNNEDNEPDLLALLNAPTDAHSWLCVEAVLQTFTSSPSVVSQSSSDGGSTSQGLGMLEGKVDKGIGAACQAVLVPESDLKRLWAMVIAERCLLVALQE